MPSHGSSTLKFKSTGLPLSSRQEKSSQKQRSVSRSKPAPTPASSSCSPRVSFVLLSVLVTWSVLVFRKENISPLLRSDFDTSVITGSITKAASYISHETGLTQDAISQKILVSTIPPSPPPPAYTSPKSEFTLTIFCAPKPYDLQFPEQDEQRRALLSWLRLDPTPKVVLLGQDPTFDAMVAQFPDSVSVDRSIDFNYYGLPQFHSIVARAQAATTDLSMIINGDIILLRDVIPAIHKVAANFDNWVLTAARWDLGPHFPFNFSSPSAQASPDLYDAEVKEFVQSKGTLHTYGGVDFWLWNNSPVQLFSNAMPPFTFGRSKYDNWLTHEMIASGLRAVVDATSALTNVHVEHAYEHVTTSVKGTKGSGNFWSQRKKSSWEMFTNVHLAQSHGTYTNQMGTALHIPWKLTACQEPLVGNMCLHRRVRAAVCSCEYSTAVLKTQSDPKLDAASRTWRCGKLSVDRKTEFNIDPNARGKSSPFSMNHSLEQLLPVVARDVSGNKVIVLVAVSFSYVDILMSFVCRLRVLGLGDNLLVAALDADIYKFAFTQGLAVYYEPAKFGNRSSDVVAKCVFGTDCFRRYTKLKSRAVLRVLKAGYSVLWSDVDVVWFSDPLPHLMSFGSNSLPIQSNEPDEKLPGNGIRRINSGFYFAWSNNHTVAAFEAIVSHASFTTLSEQPSFYDVLCGQRGEFVLKVNKGGVEDECLWKNGLRVVFLSRKEYPNGAVYGLWNETNVVAACTAKKEKCVVLHNNWISSVESKKERLLKHGLWHYDEQRRMCAYDWHSRLSPIHQPATTAKSAS